MKKNRNLLVGSLVLLLLSAGYCLSSLPEQPELSRQKTTASKRPLMSKKPAAEQLPRLRMDLLTAENQPFHGSEINLFRTLQPAIPKRPVAKRPRPVVKIKPKSEPTVPAEPVAPLPPPLVYLGQVNHDEGQTVFLRQQDEVFLVREGEQFGRQQEFRVIAIHPEVLLLSWSGSDRPVHIPLASRQDRTSRFF